MWIITRAINQYDQDGEYFHAAFINKPTVEDIAKLFKCNIKRDKNWINNLLSGGGRIDIEGVWYYLDEIKEGVEFKHKNK